ncbi:MAG: DNA-3-methyladenine glycosylase [Candidatus Pacearchaeota archaeon]
MKLLEKSFFEKETLNVAQELLGKFIVRETGEGRIVGKIVETEAYLKDDPACHASKGKTPRNLPMFEEGGVAYVYFTYGMYHCFNVVTNKKGIGEAVLIRAVEPVEGMEIMKGNRGITEIKNLCNGPSKFAIAFGIDKGFNGVDLTDKNSSLKLMQGKNENFEIIKTNRVGISQGTDLLYRFYIKGNDWVSRRG